MGDYSMWVISEILKYMVIVLKMIAANIPAWGWGIIAMIVIVGLLQWKVQRR